MLGIVIAGIGIVVFVYGVMITFGFIKTDVFKDPAIDKKLLSEKSRYFWGRYLVGVRLMVAGIGAIFLGVIIYMTH